MNKSILKKLPALLAILVVAGGVQTFTSCSSDDEGGGDGSSSSGGGSPSSSSLQTQGGGSSSSVGGDSGGGTCDANFRTVPIGTQTWMAENLNCNVNGSRCYASNPANCTKYGRLYNWSTAMGLPSSCNENICSSQINSKHKGICPEGWHLPTNEEWDKLFRFVDGDTGTESPYESKTAGKYLKATTGWNEDGNGTDQYGFSALPGGLVFVGGSFGVGEYGNWWSTSEFEGNKDYAYSRSMDYELDYAEWNGEDKIAFFSVRCVMD